MRKVWLIWAALLLTCFAGSALAEDGVDLDALIMEIDGTVKGIEVDALTFEVSEDRQHIYIDRPQVRGSESYSVAYNIYDAASQPVNYFYSLEERVAATPGRGGLFNVFVVVTDAATGERVTQNIGWHELRWPYAETLTVGRASFEVSPDRRSVYVDRPEIRCRSGEASIAYNIYDADSTPVNYFYSVENRVAATPGYDGRFNVFIVVTDTITGEQNVQNIGWTRLGEEGMETDPFITGLKADKDYLTVGTAVQVLFTVKADKTVELFDCAAPQSLGTMHDDGKNGDSKANDGVYSLRVTLNYDKAQVARFYAAAGQGRSKEATVKVYLDAKAEPDKAEQIYQDVSGVYQKLQRSLAAEGGTLSLDQALKNAELDLDRLVSEGTILSYSRTDNNLYADASFGLAMVYSPQTDALELNGNTSATTVYSIEPFAGFEMSYTRSAIEQTGQAFQHCRAGAPVSGSSVTLQTIRRLSANSIMIWRGHGEYYQEIGPVLQLDVPFSLRQMLTDSAYNDDVKNKRIVCESIFDRVCVSSRYIDQYCGNLSNSIVYLGACSSGHTDTLAQAFISHGAAAVAGFSATVISGYDDQLCAYTLSYMATLRQGSQNYNTFEQALEKAEQKVGKTDLDWARENHVTLSRRDQEAHGSSGAYLIIYGGDSARNCRLANAGIVKGKITASDTGEPLPGVRVRGGNQTEQTDTDGNYRIAVTEEETAIQFDVDPEQFEETVITAQVNSCNTATQNVKAAAWPGYLTGYVLDQDGSGIEGAKFTVTDMNGSNVTPTANNTSGITGSYTLQLPQGEYTVKVEANGYSSQTAAPVEVRRGKTDTRHFTLERKWPVVINGIIYDLINGEVTVTGHEGGAKGDSFVNEVFHLPVTAIADNAFYFNGISGELKLPRHLKTIGKQAFWDCWKLTGDIVIPDGVTKIDVSAFRDCNGFDGQLTLSEKLTEIGAAAFYECSNLKGDIVIPDGVTSIQYMAFSGCRSINGKLVLPKELKEIEREAFNGCKNLSGGLTIPQGVTNIGEYAFCGCTHLTGELIIPYGVELIGSYAFYSCQGFEGALVIPEGVKRIESHAFGCCEGFTGLSLPRSLEYLGDFAFESCSNMSGSVHVSAGCFYGLDPFRRTSLTVIYD